ncbi:MAG: pseudouridine synthase [Polaromonas sp.]|nr:pseudouridine synthase [Polaromonas sp.]
MTERKPLTLGADQKRLREQRALALERLATPTPPPDAPPTPSTPSRDKRAPSVGERPSPPRMQRQPPDARPPRAWQVGAGSPRPTAAQPPAGQPPASPLGGRVLRSDAPGSGPVRVSASAVASAAEGTRLNKRMAELGICSRREGDAWIDKGWVTVNGEVAVMGMVVQATDRIEVSEAAKGQQKHLVTILLNKPMGFVSGQAEDGHQPAISLINPRSHWPEDGSRIRFANHQLQGLAPAGRLDIDSVGLLVLTQDGRVARQLIGEDSEVDKEYLVRVTYATPDGDVATDVQAAFPAERLALLRHGLSLDGEPLKPAQVDWQNPEQLRFVLNQGKKRQIRRMCEQVGLKVVGLKRIRMGRVTLGNLPVGQWRYLGAHERF